MVADRRKVEDRIERIRRYVADLQEFARTPREAFRSNRERQYAGHAMQNAIEGCIDIASHIVAADRLGRRRITPTCSRCSRWKAF
jgi:uncharacterized protein YutE (UPF0331/DUF86 family)